MKRISVVGNRFSAFASQGNALCSNELKEMLRLGSAELDGVEIELGQGVSAEVANELLSLADAAGRRAQLRFEPLIAAGRAHVHKTQPENSLIEVPRRVAPNIFVARVQIVDDCELISDYLAGKHLPGIVIVEAARQMSLAVTEEFFSGGFPQGTAFLWTKLTVDFLAYCFPIKLSVEYIIHNHVSKRPGAATFDVELRFMQGTTCVATSRIGFDVRDRAATERKEANLALAAAP